MGYREFHFISACCFPLNVATVALLIMSLSFSTIVVEMQEPL